MTEDKDMTPTTTTEARIAQLEQSVAGTTWDSESRRDLLAEIKRLRATR